MLIFRRTNCIITASGIVTLCKRPYSMPVESGLQSETSVRNYQPARRHIGGKSDLSARKFKYGGLRC